GAAFIHDAIHAVDDLLYVRRIQRPLARRLFVSFHQMRLVPDTAHRKAADSGGELERGDGQRALSDGNGDRFSGIPLLPAVPYLPVGGGYDSLGLVGEIDAGPVAVARHIGVEGDLVDTHAVTDVVEIDIAGLDDAAMQRDGSVRL